MKAIVVRTLLLAALLGLHPAITRATEYACIAQQSWCNTPDTCFGTGIAWSGCELWCYINQGQQLSGYANCYQVP